MPGVGRYPCSSCPYVAANRRMLARHAVLIHSEKVFKCPVCPFVTRYAANWYRHKRDLHGLTKLTNCELCGFFADSTTELAEHKEAEHPETLHREKYEDKYARELLRLGGGDIIDTDSVVTEEQNASVAEKSPDEEDSVTFSLPENGFLDLNSSEEPSDQQKTESTVPSDDLKSPSLGPVKVRRSYNCIECGLLTNNPREYLYHLRDVHGEKINVFECKYCIYASKHVQKLHRHCNLVHRQLIENDSEYQKSLEASKERKPRLRMSRLGTAADTYRNGNASSSTFLHRKRNAPVFKCSTCTYQTRNKSLLFHHEKTAHLKKKFYRCLHCGYVTNDRGRYVKHIKYHSLPKMQCEYCFFKTAYKWNMDRHMKNHEEGASGTFRCTECNFTTSTKQSFKSHITHHHNESSKDLMDPEEEAAAMADMNEWDNMENSDGNDEESLSYLEESQSFDVPDTRENADAVWKEGKLYQKTLKCKSCNFKAAWPFEMRKHEESHKTVMKRHSCPICGMRFEHMAWLIKHLRRMHPENSQARNLATSYDLMKGSRRKPGKDSATESVLPIYQNILNSGSNNTSQEMPKGSMLSTLLNKPLQPILPPPSASANKFIPFKSKAPAAATNMSRHLRTSTFYDRITDSPKPTGTKIRNVPTCNICGYKTRWISELQRHMRVHSQDKPFRCHKCRYHCKWKGDLNRHLMKYHGIKVPSSGKGFALSRLRTKKSSEEAPDWSDVSRNLFDTPTPPRNPETETPLDLTLARDVFPNPYASNGFIDSYNYQSLNSQDELVDVESVPESNPMNDMGTYKESDDQESVEVVPVEGGKRKYQCPFCTFGTTTASRFHVHIVQHYNRRPFMCSVCGYNSNWEWDITKHIKMKHCRDKFHNKACVLLTDESGRRNYEKYEKYLVDLNQPPPTSHIPVPQSQDAPVSATEVNKSFMNQSGNPDTPSKTCSYDFRNIASNFEDIPENIVVTPDINFPDASSSTELPNIYACDISLNSFDKQAEGKTFFCQHCNFKHATKRVVISHLSIHAGIKPFRCRSCGISSNWRHVIVRHVKDVHDGYMNQVEDRISYVQEGFALKLTGIDSSNSQNNQNGETTHIPLFGCKICPYKCDKEFYMKFHMKQHRPREGAIYRCDYCPYFVKFKKTLLRHMRLHGVNAGNNPSDEIDMDPENYLDENELQDDYDMLHNSNIDPTNDSINISFDALSQFTENELVSPSKIKRHTCECCPYKTDNKTQYLYHKQFHRPNPGAPFKCTVCTYWATMQHLMTQHMKVHSDLTDSEQESFSSPPKSRTPPKRSLDFTPMEDDDSSDRMSVVYVKRGNEIIKMYKCKFCPMMNRKKTNVKVHLKMHGVIVNNGKFACTYCDYQCLNQGGLTNHIKIHQKSPEKEAYIEQSEAMESSLPVVRRKVFSYFCTKCPALFKSVNDLDSHSRFHGCSLPVNCLYCDYKARNKSHLMKHLSVHTPEYEAKRSASQGPPFEGAVTTPGQTEHISLVKKVDQMLLLEASELTASLRKRGEAAMLLQKCMHCPAPFTKASTLTYHVSLHGSDGQFKCTHCDYAVSRVENLNLHTQLHPIKKQNIAKQPKKPPLKTFPCPKCPAVFYKQDRYDRHLDLHGKNYKFMCTYCDYSVRFAANLIKHKKIHIAKMENENGDFSPIKASDVATVSPAVPLMDNTNFFEPEKVSYICDRCPYFQGRKDAVQSHQRRHWLSDGYKCPYCDYTSMQCGFIQSHIKTHIQPNDLFPPQAFMKFQSFKILCKGSDDDEEELVLFDDQNMLSEETQEPEEKSTLQDSESMITGMQKYPVVVLSDILAGNSDCEKWGSKLKIPKLKITKCADSDIKYSKINVLEDGDSLRSTWARSKPSLVVKISKIENGSGSDKAVYSVCSKSPEICDQARTKELSFSLKSSDVVNTELPTIEQGSLKDSPQPCDLAACSLETQVPDHSTDGKCGNASVLPSPDVESPLTNGHCTLPEDIKVEL